MSEDDLVRRLQVGHDSGCAMSYGMHEHCCDCSYPDRQESAETILKLRQDLAAARAESDLAHWLLRNARKYMNPMHEALCAAIDNALQKKQAALAGQRSEGE